MSRLAAPIGCLHTELPLAGRLAATDRGAQPARGSQVFDDLG